MNARLGMALEYRASELEASALLCWLVDPIMRPVLGQRFSL